MSITLNFNGKNGLPSTIGKYGFQITLTGSDFGANGFPGQPLFIENMGAQARLTRVDGGAFNFSAIDLAAGDPAIDVTFVASNGKKNSFKTNSPSSTLQTHNFTPDFSNVTSVEWNQGTAGKDAFVFDNLVVEWV